MKIIIILAAIALVALFDYIKESKKTEAEKKLDRQMEILKDLL